MKRQPAVIAFMAALCLAFTASFFWKSPLDLSHDEEPFNRMTMPPKSVMGDMYMDGGSIVVHVTDQAETHYELTFPIAYGKIANPYPTAFSGNINDRKTIPLKNPERAKQIAIRLLRDHGSNPPNPDLAEDYDGTANAIRSLTNPTYIKAFRFADKVKNQVKSFLP